MPQLTYRAKLLDDDLQPVKKGKRFVYEEIKLDVCRKCFDDDAWVHFIPEEVNLRKVQVNQSMLYGGNPALTHTCDVCDKPLKRKDS